MAYNKIVAYEYLTNREKFLDIVGAFKLTYKMTCGKKLTNEQLASFIGVKREHFQKLMSSNEEIDLAKVENLIARFVVWHYATQAGIESEEALYPVRIWQKLLKGNEKSGSFEPDYLLTLRKQISSALVNLQEAMQTLPEPIGPEIGAVGDPAFRKAGKTKRTERQ